ncbi:16368_t:CDS:2, partial [Acaulospora morrowiae]
PNLAIEYDAGGHKFFQRFGKIIQEIKPKAIVVISAHWETSEGIRVGSFERVTPIIYDFGIPIKELYQLTYHGKGSPKLAERIVDLLSPQFNVTIDTKRGFDHGVWIPLKVAIPEPKDLPIVQVSLNGRAPFEYHVKVGQALAPLRDEDVLLIGSGSMVHNLRAFFSGNNDALSYSKSFDRDVEKCITEYSGKEREEKLIMFKDHPLLKKAHPTVEHFVPLHVIAGASGNDQAKKIYEEFLPGLSMSSIEFDGENQDPE